ncbi:hypothetical protein ABZX12_12000 [Kribbella sp. NPDC003505]|uniref:hypothetical protein n=1 Tax=Kribbella sp. NPDC003505 TaxID=3154448 RepID=UPI00339F221A
MGSGGAEGAVQRACRGEAISEAALSSTPSEKLLSRAELEGYDDELGDVAKALTSEFQLGVFMDCRWDAWVRLGGADRFEHGGDPLVLGNVTDEARAEPIADLPSAATVET